MTHLLVLERGATWIGKAAYRLSNYFNDTYATSPLVECAAMPILVASCLMPQGPEQFIQPTGMPPTLR